MKARHKQKQVSDQKRAPRVGRSSVSSGSIARNRDPEPNTSHSPRSSLWSRSRRCLLTLYYAVPPRLQIPLAQGRDLRCIPPPDEIGLFELIYPLGPTRLRGGGYEELVSRGMGEVQEEPEGLGR